MCGRSIYYVMIKPDNDLTDDAKGLFISKQRINTAVPRELKFEANWYLCWISSDRTVQMEMFAHFIYIRLLVPFNKVQSVVPSVWCLFHLLGSPLIKYSLLYQMHDVYVHVLGVPFNKVQSIVPGVWCLFHLFGVPFNRVCCTKCVTFISFTWGPL